MPPVQGQGPSNPDVVAHETRAETWGPPPRAQTNNFAASFRQFLGVTGVRDTPLLSALVSRRPEARWMRVGLFYHAGSIAPVNTPGRGS